MKYKIKWLNYLKNIIDNVIILNIYLILFHNFFIISIINFLLLLFKFYIFNIIKSIYFPHV